MNECKLLIEENINNNGNNNKINKLGEFRLKFELELETISKNEVLLNTPTGKIAIENLNDEINEKINSFFDNVNNTNSPNDGKKTLWEYFSWFTKKIDQRQLFNSSLIKTKKFNNGYEQNGNSLELNDNYVINLAQEYLKKNGFSTIKEGIIEYWSFDIKTNENNSIIFDVYKDDELFDFKVETCIFFTKNDTGINGNYDYYKIQHESPQFINDNYKKTSYDMYNTYNNYNLYNIENKNNLDTRDEQTPSVIKKEIIISPKRVILISGNLLYSPQPLFGHGKRNYIVVKLHSNRL
jgi:hypothetical protein